MNSHVWPGSVRHEDIPGDRNETGGCQELGGAVSLRVMTGSGAR